jgi:hypothetical protein
VQREDAASRIEDVGQSREPPLATTSPGPLECGTAAAGSRAVEPLLRLVERQDAAIRRLEESNRRLRGQADHAVLGYHASWDTMPRGISGGIL